MNNRSNYEYTECDDLDSLLAHGRWRGAVKSAMRGKRGQAFLKELLQALDELPEPVLIKDEIEINGQYCMMGAVARKRGMDTSKLHSEDHEGMSDAFGIARAMVQEIMFINDEDFWYPKPKTPEDELKIAKRRYQDARKWVARHIKEEV